MPLLSCVGERRWRAEMDRWLSKQMEGGWEGRRKEGGRAKEGETDRQTPPRPVEENKRKP